MICPYSLGIWGGVQAQVLDLARELRRKGTAVQVLAPCDGPPPEPFVTPVGDSIPFAENGSLAPLAPDVPAQLRTLAAVFDERFDVLHLHEPLAPGPTLTTLVVKPVPVVGTFHASGTIGPYRYLKPVVRRLAARIDLRVAVSAEAAETARQRLGGRYDILFNAIDPERFANAEPWPTTGPTVFFCSRHEPRKGLSVLLEALQSLPRDVTLWVAGAGPETSALRSRFAADQRIQWLGAISEREKLQRLAGADVFCVPALGGESFGIVLLEAMAAGTPVVSSDIDAFREVARNGQDALLVPAGESAPLSAGLATALAGGSATAARVRSGTDRVAEFSMGRLAEEYLSRYSQILSGPAVAARRGSRGLG